MIALIIFGLFFVAYFTLVIIEVRKAKKAHDSILIGAGRYCGCRATLMFQDNERLYVEVHERMLSFKKKNWDFDMCGTLPVLMPKFERLTGG